MSDPMNAPGTAPAVPTGSPLGITDVILRDAHQSLLATRMRLEDMLPIAPALDRIGFWSLESWGGATFDACIRYLGEDPWERIRELKKAMPNTPQQMLLRGQNLLGYRHYADDVVNAFVERAAHNGVDVFRIFDAMNDPRNLREAIAATLKVGKHAQGTISYTVSPVHTLDMWVDLARQIEDMGAQSLCIKDMAGLLRPYVAFDLITRLKAALSIPIHMQCHATTGLSSATYLKAVEAGIDNLDTAISSMSMTYGHSSTEALVAMLQDTPRDTGLDLQALEQVAGYFRDVRKKYAQFEGSLKGTDSRILVAQVPGGMLTNLENQLREQQASDRLDEVLEEIPRVRQELGYIPLVTPTSQIVGTQAVINVLTGQRYKNVTKETEGVLRGEYGATPAPVDAQLQRSVLRDDAPVTERPADRLEPELVRLRTELRDKAAEAKFAVDSHELDDVLTYALFHQVALNFLQHRGDPDAFEPAPGSQADATSAPVASESEATAPAATGPATYRVTVDGADFVVSVTEEGSLAAATPVTNKAPASASAGSAHAVTAGLAGTVLKVLVSPGDVVAAGQTLLILEAMKMETEVVAESAGRVSSLLVKAGDSVDLGQTLLQLG